MHSFDSRRGQPAESGAEAQLVLQGGPDDARIIPLSEGVISLGRQPDNNVVLDEPAVSRKHAAITRTASSYFIRDLGSTNGTFVNRQRVEGAGHLLKHGDLIRLGGSKTLLMFRLMDVGARTLKVALVEAAPAPQAREVVVDARARQVVVRGKVLDPPLPRKEFDLLLLLDARRGEAVSRDEIAVAVWPERPGGDVGNHEIEQCVHRVRTHIERDTSKPEHLVTMRGYGYKLN